MSSPIMLIFLIAIVAMYFMMNRSQKKQQQQRQELMNQMKPGDEVVTIGGLHGVLHEVNADKGIVTIDCEGVLLDFDRAAIKTVKPSETALAEQTETVDAPVEEEKTEETDEENK
ncbi:MAG: preprotein translocase subunit YajC [Lactobacillales bacterium]|nr:preprotein translocase subunit YajC [Lactobacillales bacterium]